MRKIIFCQAILLTVLNSNATSQKLSQVVRGQVVDIESEIPLAFATVSVVTPDTLLGTITDERGFFRFEEIAVGRYDIKASYIGYETKVIPELMVSTGKESVLTIKMKEQIAELKEVTVKAYTRKDKPRNSMATASARSFSVEEARRYAGGFDDPARLASSFAGITTESLRDNTIVIRGNSPKGLLWRLEGVEIPNPSHFADMATFGGGGVSALSSLVVDNSDFITGAFPAEYGNATSGVFDIRLRSGNNEKHEHAFQIGSMGIDLSSEGPLNKGSRASYLFNYRYSTFGLIRYIMPEELESFLPVYQDLNFKISIPSSKAGTFSVWGLSALNQQDFDAEPDSSLWESIDDRMDGSMKQGMGGIGLNHRLVLQKHAWLNTSVAATGNFSQYRGSILGHDLQHYPSEYMDARNYKYTFTSVLNRKFSAKHTNRTGFIIDNLHYNTLSKYAPVYDMGLVTVVDKKGASNLLQVFSQSKLNLFRRFTVNAGLHAQYFDLNKEFVFEPRFGASCSLGGMQSVGFAYGMHSRIEPLLLYFARIAGSGTRPNRDLRLSKSHHLVLSYDISFNPNFRLKIEPYTQFLFDVPVIPDSNYSVLNMEAEWYFDQELVNTGTGRNTGIDVTLERFLKDGYYYLFTASLFNSTYKGDDGIERNTRFNTQYVFNLLCGKEWTLGARRNKILGINAKVNYIGGKRSTPVDLQRSRMAEDVVYDYAKLFQDKESDIFYLSATINYRINKKNHSGIWSLQTMNLLLAKDNYGPYYNYKTRQVEPFMLGIITPNLSYKIEF